MEKFFRSAWGQLVVIPTLLILVGLLPAFSTLIEQVRQEQGPTPDNQLTLGRVTRVGASAIRFGYNVPGEVGKPWSFERDQVVGAAQLPGFAVGQNLAIEYSELHPGVARVQGFGITHSVQGDFQLGIIAGFSRIAIGPFLVFSVIMGWSSRVGGLKGLIEQRRARKI